MATWRKTKGFVNTTSMGSKMNVKKTPISNESHPKQKRTMDLGGKGAHNEDMKMKA